MKPIDIYNLYPLEVEKAKGHYLFDKNAKQYLDLYGGHAVISVGHSHPHYIQRIQTQLENLAYYSNSIQMPLQHELANKLGELSGYQDYQLFLCNSGAEATENALKIASFHNQKKKVIAFKGAFHGRTALALSVTDNSALSAPINETDNVTFLEFGDLETLEKTLAQGDISAVIIEGIQGVAGVHQPSEDYFKNLSALTKKYETLLILDEIQSGYGRSGHFFAHQQAGIEADIITTAKGMGNGFPVGGVLIHPDIQLKKGQLGTTFGGNPLASAAALAVLEIMEEEQLLENAKQQGSYLKEALSKIDGIKEVRGTGLMWGLDFDFPIKELRKALLFEYGVFTGVSGSYTLRLLPALNVGKTELDYFIQQLELALSKQTILL